MLNHDLHVPELSDVFLVGENEHRQTACPHQNQRGLLDQDANFITMIPTCHKIYTPSVLLEIRLIINSESCTNVLSALTINKLDLKSIAHPLPIN
ncbi:hypothetical protein Bca4012_050074 [Brassica carinata]